MMYTVSTFFNMKFSRFRLQKQMISYWTKKAAISDFLMMCLASSEFSLSNRISLRDRLTFFQCDGTRPPGPPPRLKASTQSVLKLQLDLITEEVHTLWVQSYSISLLGIVRIHKYSTEMWKPLWLVKTHNALCCCCELLTAWAGPQQQAALRSRQRGGILDISPWWQPCYYSLFVLCASPQCGSPVAT